LGWYRKTAEGWLLELHIQPGAKKSEVAGLHGDALKIRIASPPVDGKANAALVAFVAGALDVPKSAVEVIRGETSRRKCLRVNVEGADPGLLLS
jgi:uncharacterized protein (TIGR00251 family)